MKADPSQEPEPLPESAPKSASLAATWGPQWALLWPLAVPIVLSQFASNALSLIVTAVLGRLGTAQVAAAGFAQAIYYLFFIILLGVMLAVPPRMARAFGAADYAALRLHLRSGLVLATVLTALFLPSIWLISLFMPQWAAEGINANYAVEFLRLYSLSMWAVLLTIPLRGVLEATGRAQVVTWVALGSVAFALLMSPALAFGWWVLPKLGLAGAALGALLAAWLMLALLWPLAMRRLRDFPVSEAAADSSRRSELWPDLRHTLVMGIPIGLTLGVEGGLFNISSLLMSRFGADTLAAHEITLRIITALFMIPLGIASATSLRVGQEYGAGNHLAARRAGFLGMGAATGIMLLFAGVSVLAPKLLIALFMDVSDPKNAAAIGITVGFLSIAALFQAVDGLQVAANAALRGLQDTRVPFVISLVSYWLIGLGVGVPLAFHFGLGGRGLWYGMSLGLFCAGGLLLWRFWRKTRLFAQQAPSQSTQPSRSSE